jgi:hypothetical protein
MPDYVVKVAVIGLVKRRDASVIYQVFAEMKIAVELMSYWVGTQIRMAPCVRSPHMW